MKILLIGSGGREHALAWRIAASDLCNTLYCAPGNPGIEEIAACVDIAVDEPEKLVAFATDNAIDLVVVGPEAPLVDGLADRMKEAGIKVFGPDQKAAALEGSKGFMKDLCAKYDIPTAAYGRFTDPDRAVSFIRDQGAPIVVKADGLAAGKGVVICQSVEEAEKAAREMLSGQAFGAAGRSIVVEEFMAGEEISFFAIADGKTVLPLTCAQDHKQVGEGDTGPNTGGMGAYSPVHCVTPDLERAIIDDIIHPTVAAMAQENRPFSGLLYAGLMIVNGKPKVVEFNVRFGDPECQVLMMRLQSDLLKILDAAANEQLAELTEAPAWSPQTALCVVMTTKGYPGAYEKGSEIKGLDQAAQSQHNQQNQQNENFQIFHAGTARNAAGALVANGGRVLGITAAAADIARARSLAYGAVDSIDWPQGFCRRDIGWRELETATKKAAAGAAS